jgi:CHRD domain-containing protein
VRSIIATALLAAVLAVPPLAAAAGGAAGAARTTLSGRAAVPKGARHGRAHASLRFTGRRVCWSFQGVRGIDRPRTASIDKAIPGEFGPVMVRLGRRYRAAGCVVARPGVAAAIAQSPQGFYVTVATRRFPLGAIRGQLAPA